MPKRFLFLILAAAALVALALGWRQILFAYAVFAAEKRPALVADAEWGKPETAVAFGKRFGRGVPERELLTWLSENRFSLYPPQHRAERLVLGMPCNENIVVTWSADAARRIEHAAATVRAAGCF